MVTMRDFLILIVFSVAALYGGYEILRGVRKVRAPRAYKDVLYAWTERPGPSFTYDFTGWLGITVHRVALVIISLVALFTALRHPQAGVGLSALPGWVAFLAEPITYGAVALLGCLFGLSFFGPVAEYFGGDHRYALSNEGLLIGGQLIPWSAFSEFTVDIGRNLIFIWSASLRGTPAMFITLPSTEELGKLREILQNHLPYSDPSPVSALRRYAFPAWMACLAAPFIAAACALFLAPLYLALIGDTLIGWVLLALGGQLIVRLIYGGKSRPAPMS
jgi:hypothetical protein